MQLGTPTLAMTSVDELMSLWNAKVPLYPTAFIHGNRTPSIVLLKEKCAAVAPVKPRVKTTVRFPPITVLDTTLT